MRSRRAIFAILAALTSGLVATAALEGFLRLRLSPEVANGSYWGPGAFIADPEVGYRHAPGFHGFAERAGAFRSEVEISALGLRQLDVDEQARYSRRVLVLGDSFPFGLGVAEEESFPGRLRARLNPEGIGVVNGAQTGYDLSQEIAWGRRIAERVQPNAVLLSVFLSNDAPAEVLREHERIQIRYGYRLSTARICPWAPCDWLRTHSYLVMQVRQRIFDPRERWRQKQEFRRRLRVDQDGALATVLAPVRELISECRRHQRRCGVVLVPTKKGGVPLHDGFADALGDLGIPFLDLNGRLEAAEHYFEKDGHWNASGHAAAARLIAPFVRRLVEEPGEDTATAFATRASP